MESTAYTRNLPKFCGTNFRHWRDEMLLFLTTMDMARFLKEDLPAVQPEDPDDLNYARMTTWTNGDFECKSQILFHLSFPIFVMFTGCNTAKELWEALENTFKDDEHSHQAKRTKVDVVNLEDVEEVPLTVEEAMSSKDAPYWKEAIRDQISHLMENMEGLMWNYTWNLLEDAPGMIPLGYKWRLRKKRIGDGTIFKYKATLQGSRFKHKESLE